MGTRMCEACESTPMRRLTAQDPETKSDDPVARNIEQLQHIFPEAWTEGKVDFEVLKQLLGGQVDEREEKYGLNWHGKRRARQFALTPSAGTLRPCPLDSVDWDTTRNLMIEGDNLEVLKLLQKSYAGKVKLIYIDPPYNTGKDFVYPDNFQDSIRNYLELTGQTGDGGKRLSSNTEASGRYHTDWLNMMYPRIKQAHSLLRRDGAIFVSCDECEQPRLRMMMDDIFGGENFIADLIWAAGRKNDSRLISISHECIVCYSRDSSFLRENKIEWRQKKKGLEEIYSQYDRLTRLHGDDYPTLIEGMKAWFKSLADSHPSRSHKHYHRVDKRGLYFAADISWPGGGGPRYEVLHPKTKKPVKVPARGWSTPDPKKMKEWMGEDRVDFGEDETTTPCFKKYLKDSEYQPPYSVFYQDGRAATKRFRELMGEDCFNFPKDECVLQELIAMMTSANDLIVDFFAGSGTTGHAVMSQNAADGGNRRFILVQLPEPLDPANKDQKVAADYCDSLGKPRSIAELTKERLRRAGSRVRAESPMFAGDLGFRVYKLDSTNIHEWEPSPKDLEANLQLSIENLKAGRSTEDILSELLLKLGLDLCVPVEQHDIAGKEVYAIGGGVLMVCLERAISNADTEPLALGIADWLKQLNPAGEATCIFRDSAFENDVAKSNLVAILEQHGSQAQLNLKIRSL
jgi:adenine-specific DNA-methyltransferase